MTLIFLSSIWHLPASGVCECTSALCQVSHNTAPLPLLLQMPGHSSFGKGMPHLTIPACGGTLDPTQDATYEFLVEFLNEMAVGIFTDPYLALGGDEVSFGCAAGVRKAWLAIHNMSATELLPYFWKRVTADVLPKLTQERTLHVWGTDTLSNLDPGVVPPGTVFNLYTKLDATLETTAARGVPGILSAPYYLDQTQSYRMGPGLGDDGNTLALRAQTASGDHACGVPIGHINQLWQCFYSASPTDGITDPTLAANRSLVLGGESCIWGEGTSASSIEVQTLTLAAAVAERLWTGDLVEGGQAATGARLANHVCLLTAMGLRASPVNPGFCMSDLV